VYDTTRIPEPDRGVGARDGPSDDRSRRTVRIARQDWPGRPLAHRRAALVVGGHDVSSGGARRDDGRDRRVARRATRQLRRRGI